jgi:hypothetical protein
MSKLLTRLFMALHCGIFALQAHAQQLPSPIDLKAAYCIPVVNHTIGLIAPSADNLLPSDNSPFAELTRKHHSELIARRRRLNLFLTPRIAWLDSSSIVVAVSRGKEDVSKLSEIQRVCDLKCGNVGNLDTQFDCREQCGGEYDAVKQIRTCNDLSWLPL